MVRPWSDPGRLELKWEGSVTVAETLKKMKTTIPPDNVQWVDINP